MKIFGIKMAGAVAASVLGLFTLAQPARLVAQTASIHGHVQNPAGLPQTNAEVRLTTSSTPNEAGTKFEYTFPVDANGDYKGTGIKPNSYIPMVFSQGKSIDFMPQTSLAANADKTIDFDMTRKEYVDKMTKEDRAALEEYKKKAAATLAANAKIGNLNSLLKASRDAVTAGNYDEAISKMTEATTAKPDEPILWDTLGDAQLGAANAAAKAAGGRTTDPAVVEKYNAAQASYQKAIDLNAKLPKPNVELAATAQNQIGQTYGKTGKVKEAAEAYETAAKTDPTKAGMYFYNEAATLFNASDMDNAAAAADKAVAADPTKVEAYYIKGQALIQKATVDPKTNKITAPPECIAAYQKYLELAPTGPHAEEVKGILQGIGEPIKSSYKAGKK